MGIFMGFWVKTPKSIRSCYKTWKCTKYVKNQRETSPKSQPPPPKICCGYPSLLHITFLCPTSPWLRRCSFTPRYLWPPPLLALHVRNEPGDHRRGASVSKHVVCRLQRPRRSDCNRGRRPPGVRLRLGDQEKDQYAWTNVSLWKSSVMINFLWVCHHDWYPDIDRFIVSPDRSIYTFYASVETRWTLTRPTITLTGSWHTQTSLQVGNQSKADHSAIFRVTISAMKRPILHALQKLGKTSLSFRCDCR